MRRLLTILIFVICFSQSPLSCATNYRYVAGNYDGIYLFAPDGVTKLLLAKSTEIFSWSDPAVSENGTIVAVLAKNTDDAIDSPMELYLIDPITGKKQSIFKGRGYQMLHPAVWMNKDTILLQRVNKEGYDAGVYAVSIRTGAAKQVIPPIDSESEYQEILLSPSGKLIATSHEMTCATWLSVSDIGKGKRCWQTNPMHGMVGYSSAAWSADSRSLFVSFYMDKSDEMFDGSPGGLWKFDALTGKQYLWRYRNRSITAVWPNEDHKILAVEIGDYIDYIDAANGKLLYRVSTSKLGGIFYVYFRGAGDSLVCGTRRLAVVDSSGKIKRMYDVHTVIKTDYATDTRYSPARNAVMYFNSGAPQGTIGTVDLSTGKLTGFPPDTTGVDWLIKDVVR